MIFQLEIQNEDLDYIINQENCHGIFTLNRYDERGSKIVSRLLDLGIITEREYYGESICYHPSYNKTNLGRIVFEKYLEEKSQ